MSITTSFDTNRAIRLPGRVNGWPVEKTENPGREEYRLRVGLWCQTYTPDKVKYVGLILHGSCGKLASAPCRPEGRNISMRPQIIRRNGKPEYAVVPYDEYRRLVEDAEMLADVRAFDAARKTLAAGEEEPIPAEVVDRLLYGDNPVRVLREHRRLSAADLAKACGVTAAAISQIETGKRKPSVTLLKKIAGVLNVDLDTLAATGDDSRAGGQ